MESRSMKPQALNDWQELSALYEQADALEDADLDIWLTQLRGQGHPLLSQLEQMLDAREQVKRNGFLDAPPALRLEPEPLAHEWHEDSRVGAYRLLRRLGSGGMAEVWLAQRDDGAFQRQVAIKLLFRHASQLGGATGSTQRDSFAQRFSRERDILASLHHPNIAGLHDAGVTPTGQPWLALEYVEGEPLTDWCNQRKLGIEARVRLFRQVLLAVQHAHANLVIHRDLKPANILVTPQSEVRLLDFGIAKLMEPEGGTLVETELTRMSGRPLTVAYASPEQLLGQPLNTACDVYSLGVVLYEMLCGERPYELKVETAAQLEQAILDVEPRAPSRRVLTESTAQARGTTPQALRKQLASDLDAITLRALGKRPSQRYGSVEALRADIDRWLAGEAVGARTPSALYHLRKFVGRHPVGVSLGVAAIASLVAAAAIAVWQGVQAREESARAVAARDFMLNIFQRADQEKSRGATVTARDLLETGRKDVVTRLVGQPKLQAELLHGIAKIQERMGEYVSADSTHRDLVRIYQNAGDARTTVLALADQADNATRMFDLSSAAQLIAKAKEVRGRRLGDVEVNARLDEIEGWIARARGDAAQARELLERSRRGFSDALGADHLRTFYAGRKLAQAERALGNFDKALALHDSLERSASRVEGLDDKERAGLDWERIDLLYVAGVYARALSDVEIAEPRCTRLIGADAEDCRLLSLKAGLILLRLGWVGRANAVLPRIAAIAHDVRSPLVRTDATLLALRIESASRPDGVEASFEAVRALSDSGDAVISKPAYKASALLALAESRLRSGQPGDARKWAEQALELAPGGPTLAIGQSLLGIGLLHQGQPQLALKRFSLANDAFSSSLGADHPLTQLFMMNQALALERLGKQSDAIAILDHAQPILRHALGSDAPTYLRVLDLRSRLELPGRSGENGRKQGMIEFFS
jgi:serine/threonine protein kinase/tetratricopeptide (TPR) repeat protein